MAKAFKTWKAKEQACKKMAEEKKIAGNHLEMACNMAIELLKVRNEGRGNRRVKAMVRVAIRMYKSYVGHNKNYNKLAKMLNK